MVSKQASAHSKDRILNSPNWIAHNYFIFNYKNLITLQNNVPLLQSRQLTMSVLGNKKLDIFSRYNYCSLPKRSGTTPSFSDPLTLFLFLACSWRPLVSTTAKAWYSWELVPVSRDNVEQGITLWENKTSPGQWCWSRIILNKKNTSKGSNAYIGRKLKVAKRKHFALVKIAAVFLLTGLTGNT